MRNTKEDIVLAAVNLFAEKGYTETSIREIAEAVGIQAGSLYAHFPSKMAILEHILEIYSKLLDQTVPELEDMLEHMDTKTILKTIFFSFPEDENNLYGKILKILLQEQYRNEKIHLYIRDGFFTALQAGIKSMLDKLIQLGRLAPVDTNRYAKLINYISVAASMEYCHYTPEEYAQSQPITQFELLDLVVDSMLEAT